MLLNQALLPGGPSTQTGNINVPYILHLERVLTLTLIAHETCLRKSRPRQIMCAPINYVLKRLPYSKKSNVASLSYHLPQNWFILGDTFVVMTLTGNFDARPISIVLPLLCVQINK